MYYSNFDKGHAYSSQWKFNFKHKYLKTLYGFDIVIVETQRTFSLQKLKKKYIFFWYFYILNPNTIFVKNENRHTKI